MKKKKVILGIVLIIIMLCVVGCFFGIRWIINNKNEILEPIYNLAQKKENLIDDWKYSNSNNYERNMVYESKALTSGAINSAADTMSEGGSTLGFAVGGAKGIENFRENIKNNYLPLATDITYNGLFYDYYFNTGNNNIHSNELFMPSYSTAVSKDPISGNNEFYMTVGLNSNIKESDFKRKKLNIVVVMDISGSMSSGFNKYYYGGKSLEGDSNDDNKSKMKIANESLNLLIDSLNSEDRLGIVLFDNNSYLAKPVSLIGETDVEKIKEHVLEITPQGGTNFDAGYTTGTELFTEEMLNDPEYENRIIVITDAMPNVGKTSKDTLTKDVEKNADKGIYTSFIGVGVDFNTEVIECLSNVTGSNYFSVHSSEEFKKIMSDDFDYMVTPLVFDLELKLDSNEFKIEQVYGTDCKDKNSGTIMKVNTLFPSSRNSSGEAKGGIILLKLTPTSYTSQYIDKSAQKTNITVSYKDGNGKMHTNTQEVKFKNFNEEYYDNTGIRKGIVLTRYANLMKEWILFERTKNPEYIVTSEKGICHCGFSEEQYRRILGENERTSMNLNISKEYAETFAKFKEYMKKEINEIGDKDMNQEIEILDLIVK